MDINILEDIYKIYTCSVAINKERMITSQCAFASLVETLSFLFFLSCEYRLLLDN